MVVDQLLAAAEVEAVQQASRRWRRSAWRSRSCRASAPPIAKRERCGSGCRAPGPRGCSPTWKARSLSRWIRVCSTQAFVADDDLGDRVGEVPRRSAERHVALDDRRPRVRARPRSGCAGARRRSAASASVTKSRWIGCARSTPRRHVHERAVRRTGGVQRGERRRVDRDVAAEVLLEQRARRAQRLAPGSPTRTPARRASPTTAPARSGRSRTPACGHSAWPNMNGASAARGDRAASGAGGRTCVSAIGATGVKRQSSSRVVGKPELPRSAPSPRCRERAEPRRVRRRRRARLELPSCAGLGHAAASAARRATRSPRPRARAPAPCRPTSRSGRRPARARSRARCS